MKQYLSPFLFLLAILIACLNPAFSQRVSFVAVPPPEIDPWSIVTSITQDNQGYMWFAGNGIHRFDGIHTVTYRNEPTNPNSLVDNAVESMFADDNNQLWIGTQGAGLDCFNIIKKTFTHYPHKKDNDNSVSFGTIASITKDHEGFLWLGTGDGVDKFDPKTGKFKHYKNRPGDSTSLSSNVVRTVYVDKQDEIWVGTGSPFHSDNEKNDSSGGLNRLNRNTNKFTRYLHHDNDPNSLADNRVRAIYEDNHGTFWVGSAGDGLHTLDRTTGKFTRYPYNPQSLSRPPIGNKFTWVDDHITFIREDAAGYLWIGTMLGGLTQYDPKTKSVIRYGSGAKSTDDFPDQTAWTGYPASDGTFWISSWQAGLFKINPFEQKFPYFKLGETVHGFFKEENGDMWICTETGITKLDSLKKIIRKYPLNMRSGFTYDIIQSFQRDNAGVFWIATSGGLVSFNPATEKTSKYIHEDKNNYSLSHNTVLSTLEDHKGDFYVGTLGGLNKMDRKTGKFFHYKDEEQNNNTLDKKIITVILEDKLRNFWTGNYDGVNLIDPTTGATKNYLKGISVYSMFEDSDSILWVGGSGGLFRYQKSTDSFSVVRDPTSGIEFNNVADIIEDTQQRLWFSSTRGNSCFNKNRDSSSLFENWFGLKNIITGGPELNSSQKKMFLSDSTGFYEVSLEKVTANLIPATLAITDFRLGEQSLFTTRNPILPDGLTSDKTINLSYKENVFSFDFDVLHYINPINNQCLYKLENYDDKWRQPGSQRTASYFNVPPGNYIFRVKGSNANGIWIEKDISIIISPPWWQRWWAYSIFTIVFLCSIWAFIAYRSRKLSRENRLLEEKVTHRTDQLKQSLENLKSTQAQLIQSEKMASLGELTAGIAHEIQNPLNFVNNFSEVNAELSSELEQEIQSGNLEEAKLIAKDIKENSEKIKSHGKRADAIVKGMLQHSGSGAGQQETTDTNALADEYLRLAYHGLRAKDKVFNATINTDYDNSIGNVNVVPQDIARVLLNLYNNAFYAINEKKKIAGVDYIPTISVTTKKEQDCVWILVEDNGNGIPRNIVEKIFQPFFTTKPSGSGTGLGLSLSYDIVKAHNGEIKVETKENEGSKFIIQLPVKVQ